MTRNSVHGLPETVRANGRDMRLRIEDLVKDPDGRPHYWLHEPTGEVFNLHPQFPNEPILTDAQVVNKMRAGEETLQYVVCLPNGARVTCSDEASRDAVIAMNEHLGLAPPAVAEEPAPPTSADVAAHKEKLAKAEAEEQALLAAALAEAEAESEDKATKKK